MYPKILYNQKKLNTIVYSSDTNDSKPHSQDEDISILNEISKAKENIKRKYMALKSGESNLNQLINHTFKPIIEPLNKISNKRVNLKSESHSHKTSTYNNEYIVKHKSDVSILEEPNEEQSLIQYYDEVKDDALDDDKYQFRLNTWFKAVDIDKTYGPKKHSDERITIGNKEVEFNKKSLLIEENEYMLTPGLLFNKNPSIYTEQDLEAYKAILIQTSVHLNRDGRIKTTGNKYKKNIISKLFPSGGGLSKKLQKHNLIYWNDSNELVDRLCLLLASKAAGNTGVGNEITAIFEELLEAGLIKRIPNV